MLSRLASLLLKTPAKIALGLVAAYFLFAWFGFEPLLMWAAPKYIADKSRHTLSLQSARFDPFALSLSVKGLRLAEPDGKPLLAFAELFVDFEAASLFKWAYTFADIRLSGPDARLELRPDGSLNWMALIEALKSKEEEPDQPLPRLLIRRIVLEKGKVAVADRKVAFETRLDPLDLTLTELSTLPEDKGAYTLAATTQVGARIRWKGDVILEPLRASGQLSIDRVQLARAWPYLKGRLDMVPPEGEAALALDYRVGWADKKLSLVLDKLGLTLDKLALRGRKDAAPALALERLALTGGRFDLGKRSLEIGEIAVNGGHVDLRRDADGRMNVQEWFASPSGKGREPEKAALASQAKEPPWRVDLARFGLDGVAVRFTDLGFVAPKRTEVGNLRVGFGLRTEVGAGPLQLRVGDLGVDVSGVRVFSGNDAEPLLVVGGVTLEDGSLDLAAATFAARRVAVLNGRTEAARDREGRIPLLQAYQRIPSQTTALAVRQEVAQAASAWQYRIENIDLAGFQLDLRDEAVEPAVRLTLADINASAMHFSQNLDAPLPVKLAFRVKEGGRFEAAGKVVPAGAEADIRLTLADLALAPAQPWLGQAANLVLAGGRASTAGRVQYGKNGVRYSGGFHVDDLLVNESEGGARFLAWKRLGSDSVSASQEALEIDELRLDSLGAKLVIYQDKTVNLKKILKSAPPPADGVAKPGAKPAAEAGTEVAAAKTAATAEAKASPAFRMTIARVRVEHGELDFADLSLALPFGTRIHDFKGAFNGISTQSGTLAELELDGRVDEYGLARAVGQIDLFDPTAFMDIKVVFRNVEMKNLTPYTATFAGRKIDSGKLSLDLEYKIKQRQLLGENQIIMDKLTLGERVQSPTAKDLPLDLAIAILQDSDGRIDLGLPVSGSLDDPQFSYGRIIWKAIGNIITKIVTAPFRALGALFGGSGEKLEKIAFEAGEAGLTPPEKEKFKQIAQILGKRPGLALSVHGVWSAEIDRPVMKEQQLRRAVAEKMGLKLAPDEDAGPISTSNAKVQTALEVLYAARIGEQDWKTLQAKWFQANPEQKQESGAGKMLSRLKGLFKPEQPLSEADMSALKGSDLHALIYARLLDKESVGDAALTKLAEQRAQAIVEGLAAAGAPAERIQTAAIEPFAGEGKEVPAKLELGVAAKR